MAVILGVDPGSRVCGYGVITARGSQLEFIACGCIRVAQLPFPQRLQHIHDGLSEIIATHQPETLAVEEVFMGKNASSALKLGQARGAAIVACVNRGLEVAEYPARKVKQALAGSGRADKHQLQHMVTALLALTELPEHDAADALSVAVCHAHTQHGLVKMAGVNSRRRGRFVGR